MPGASQTLVPLFRVRHRRDGPRSRGGGCRPPDQGHGLPPAPGHLHARGRLFRCGAAGRRAAEAPRVQFQVGAALEVKLGGRSDRVTKPLFKGEIVTVELDFGASGVSMVVRAYDHSHRMMRSRKQRTFMDVTISTSSPKVCRGARAEPPRSSQRMRSSHYSSFRTASPTGSSLAPAAGRVGAEPLLEVSRRPSSRSPGRNAEVVELAYPDDLHPSVPASPRCSRRRPSTCGAGKPTSGSVWGPRRTPDPGHGGGDHPQPGARKFSGEVHRDRRAVVLLGGRGARHRAGHAQPARQSQLAAEGECDGNPLIKAGTRLRIRGVGAKFSGHVPRRQGGPHALGRRLRHPVLQLLRRAHAARSVRRGQRGARRVDSIVIGVGTNNNDPEGLGRVKVMLPSVSEVETFWPRWWSRRPGKDRGLMSCPVPNEQVIVAFENGDPSYPVRPRIHVQRGETSRATSWRPSGRLVRVKSDHKALIRRQGGHHAPVRHGQVGDQDRRRRDHRDGRQGLHG